jgi:hypothetical protein
MPAPTHLIIVSPLDKLTAVQVKWGVTISPTAPDIYTLADAAPRSATHKVRSGCGGIVATRLTKPLRAASC